MGITRTLFVRFPLLYFLPLWVLGSAPSASPADVPPAIETHERDEGGCETFQFNANEMVKAGGGRIASYFDNYEGKIIRNISYRQIGVFNEADEKESNAFYRFINKLHINTRTGVVAPQLLFEEGDAFDKDAVAETERILRSRHYLASAYIVPDRICEKTIDLVVVTQDSWTTEPEISFSHAGGDSGSGFGFTEGNILGYGNNLTIGYEKDLDRDRISYAFDSPHLFQTPLRLSLGFADNSDGQDINAALDYPFYSLKTPTAFGVSAIEATADEVIRLKEQEINEYRHALVLYDAYWGFAPVRTRRLTNRWLFGISKEVNDYSSTDNTRMAIPGDRNVLYPWVEFQTIENNYAVYTNVNQIQRREDISMGVNARFRFGYGGSMFDNAQDVWRFMGEYSDLVGVGEHHILKLSAAIDGRYYPGLQDSDSTVLSGEVAYNFFEDQRYRWYASLKYDIGKDLQQHEELTLGGIVGLRGYPTDFQRGDRRYIASIERRYFSHLHIFNLFRLGGAVYFDTGKAWQNNNFNSTPMLSNVGIGLRLSSSKAHIGSIIHVDLAFPTGSKGDIKKYQWLVKAKQSF